MPEEGAGENRPGDIVIDGQRPEWMNFHKTVRNTMIRLAAHASDASDWKTAPAPTWSVSDFARAVAEQQSMLARWPEETLVAGAAWSHARLLRTDRSVLEMPGCCGMMALEKEHMEDGASPEGMCLVAGGTRLKQIATWLEGRNCALRTSGSHGAVTIAGAFATGTHGARPDTRGVEEHVAGVLLVPGQSRACWVCPEQGRRPATDLLRGIHPDIAILESDELFSATLCHLGALGIVTAVLFRPEGIRRREVVKQIVPLWDGWEREWASDRFDLIAGRVGEAARRKHEGWKVPGPLLHCEVNLDPWALTAGAGNGCFNLRFDAGSALQDPVGTGPENEAPDILYQAISRELDRQGIVPPAAPDSLTLPLLFEAAFFFEQAPSRLGRRLDTPGRLLPADHEQIKKYLQIWSTAIAVPTGQIPEALIAIGEAAAEWPTRNFVTCLRPVMRSHATLGFCGWDSSTVIDFDGLGDTLAPGQIEKASRLIFRSLERHHVSYRSHWGKLAEPDAAKIASDYGGQALGSWKAARSALLGDEGGGIFTSPRLKACGLA